MKKLFPKSQLAIKILLVMLGFAGGLILWIGDSSNFPLGYQPIISFYHQKIPAMTTKIPSYPLVNSMAMAQETQFLRLQHKSSKEQGEQENNGNNDAQLRQKYALEAQKLLRELPKAFKANQWKEANEITFNTLVLSAYSQSLQLVDSHVPGIVWTAIPCQTIKAIDQLWRTASDGRFGFTVQMEIYRQINKVTGDFQYYPQEVLAERVGWLENGRRKYYFETTWSLEAEPGHLPRLWVWGTDAGMEFGDYLDQINGVIYLVETCQW